MRNLTIFLLGLAVGLAGCRSSARLPDDQRTRDCDTQVRAKWGKGLDDLPRVRLDIISPHNEHIQREYAWAFSLWHAIQYGQTVEVVWRDVGGGGSTIQQYLEKTYEGGGTSDVDVLWGGGDLTFNRLLGSPHSILVPLDLAADVLDNIPQSLHGQDFYGLKKDDQKDSGGQDRPLARRSIYWVGSALSGFGFLVNTGMMRKCRIDQPQKWEDLGDDSLTDLLVLADPGQSGSVASTYLNIVKTAPTWSEGWAKLVMVLSNAKRISDSAGAAANAPVLGDALVASCIDFYGLMRVAEAPDELSYVSPEGQTTFGSDPIGILRGAPHPAIAERFVNFVMSAQGQALWAVRVGSEHGPVRNVLGRQPIRKDVYATYADRLAPSIVNPYQAGMAMAVVPQMNRINFGVFRNLVVAAAVDNTDYMRAARRRLNELARDPSAQDEYRRRLAIFTSLPADADAIAKMGAVADRTKDLVGQYEVARSWRDFFRHNFQEVAK